MNLFLLLALILSPGLGFAAKTENAKSAKPRNKYTINLLSGSGRGLNSFTQADFNSVRAKFIGPLTKAASEALYGKEILKNSPAEKTENSPAEKTESLPAEKTESLPADKTENTPVVKETQAEAKEVVVNKEENKLPITEIKEELIKETAVLTDAPLVPAPITRTKNALVTVDMEIKEHIMEIAKEVHYNVWTFGGRVPGKFIRIRHGDTVQFNLHNHQNNKFQHNIDLHAVTGPGGGAGATAVLPGHTATFGFKALNPGLYVYHCATQPVPEHIANGMYGLILVQPEDYTTVDHEYYIMQSEFYTKQPNQQKGLRTFSLRKAIMEEPSFVVFNGHKDGLTRIKLAPKIGDKVRIYIGNGGPNLISAFHIIGEVFDKVYLEGNTSVVANNIQTTAVLPGGSTIVEFSVEVPGTYAIVDHSITRTFHKGCLGLMQVLEREKDKTPEGKEVIKKVFASFEARPNYRGN